MKTRVTLLMLLTTLVSFGQAKFEIQEFTGTIEAIEPGWGFAYEVIILNMKDEVKRFSFHPAYGTEITQKLKVGDGLTLKANINITIEANLNKLPKEIRDYWVRNQITEIFLEGKWKLLKTTNQTYSNLHYRVTIEKKVEKDMWLNNFRNAIVYENNKIAYCPYNFSGHYPLEHVAVGDVVSFIGTESLPVDGYSYPFVGVTKLSTYRQLIKIGGVISSFLYKQNFACIGMALQSGNSKIKLGFPSEFAKQIKSFSGEGQKVTVYYDDNFKIDNQLEPPSLYALVYGKDTIRIESLFYGGADGKHEHLPVDIKGKISRTIKSDRGRVIGLILGSDFFIDVNFNLENQLAEFLSKGTEIKVEGDERIKKEGEIYSKDYRIITPKKVTVNGKLYLVN